MDSGIIGCQNVQSLFCPHSCKRLLLLVNLLNRWLYGIKKNKDSLDDGNRMQLVDGLQQYAERLFR